jgi:hypothetical protein
LAPSTPHAAGWVHHALRSTLGFRCDVQIAGRRHAAYVVVAFVAGG